MLKKILIYDITTFILLAAAIVLKIVGVFTFSWWWLVGGVALIIVAEFVIATIWKRKIFF